MFVDPIPRPALDRKDPGFRSALSAQFEFAGKSIRSMTKCWLVIKAVRAAVGVVDRIGLNRPGVGNSDGRILHAVRAACHSQTGGCRVAALLNLGDHDTAPMAWIVPAGTKMMSPFATGRHA